MSFPKYYILQNDICMLQSPGKMDHYQVTCSRDELRWHGGRLYVEDDTDTALEMLTQLCESFHNIRWREWCLDKFFSVNAIVGAFSDFCENCHKVSLAALHMSAAAAPCLRSSSPGLGGARLGQGHSWGLQTVSLTGAWHGTALCPAAGGREAETCNR